MMYLLVSVIKSTPPQHCQLIVYSYRLKYSFDGFVREFDISKLINEYIVSDNNELNEMTIHLKQRTMR